MSVKMSYEKPAMKKVELRANKGIANTCWGYANQNPDNNPTYWYELSNTEWANGLGKGTYVGFKVGAGNNCKSVNSFEYMIVDYGDTIKGNPELEAQARTDLANHLGEIGAFDNGGSPFKGEEGFATTPGKSW